ncbi:hypothetical protein DSO57_1020806, partial [Entomophthora muscae]
MNSLKSKNNSLIANQQLSNLGTVRIDNSSSLETQAQEQKSKPDPRSPWAARPVDQRITILRFSGIEPLQAEAENVGPCSETGQTKEIIAPNGKPITAPNRVANQEQSPGRGTGQWPNPMTTTLKLDNQ